MTITETRLSNGLRVLTDPMPQVETVSLGAWVDVGARHESVAENGISHLMEHMAFKGTERRSARVIAEEVENVGGYLNAATSREHTCFYAKVLKADAALAVDVIGDILQHSVFDPEELEREKAVVIQEIAQADDTPDDIVFDFFQATAFPDQALGRPILGTPESVSAVARESLAEFLKTRYTAEAMVVAAAGAIEHEDFVRLVERHFNALPTGPAQPAARALYRGGDFREARDLEQAQVVMGFEGVSYEHPHYYAHHVLSTLLGGGMSSRLFQEVREKRGLAYSVYSYASSYVDGGLFTVYAGAAGDQVAGLIPVLCDEITGVLKGITDDELKRARAQLKASILMSLESTSSRLDQMGRQILTLGRVVSVEEMVEGIEAVDAAMVKDATAAMLVAPPTIALLGDLGEPPGYAEIVERMRVG